MQTLNETVKDQEKPIKKHKLSLFYRFFCLCSGARIYILKQCPSEYNKFFGIGVIVFLTGLMASLSGGYALFTVFRSIWVSLAFGVLWGVLIFSIDWYIVSSLRKHQQRSKEFGMAAPRFFLAVIIAFVISMPLKMKLFEREIEQQMLFNQQQSLLDFHQLVSREFDEISRIETENLNLRNEIQKKEEQRNALFNMMITEAEGLSPTRTPGKGPLYREKRLEYEKVDAELKNIRELNTELIILNNQTLEKLRSRRDEVLKNAQVVSTGSDGFLARLDAMSVITNGSRSLQIASWFIILLFVVIESAPIIVKLLSNRGPYDDLLEAEEYIKQVEVRKVVVQAELTEDHRIDLHRLLEKERNEKLYEVEKDHILTEAKVLSQINKMKIQKWKEEEFSKLSMDGSASVLDFNTSINDENKISSVENNPEKHFTTEVIPELKDLPLDEDDDIIDSKFIDINKNQNEILPNELSSNGDKKNSSKA